MARFFLCVTDKRRDRRTTLVVDAMDIAQAKSRAIAEVYPGSVDMPHQRSNLEAHGMALAPAPGQVELI